MSNTCRTDERCPHLRTIARPLTLLSLVFAGCINDTLIGRDPDVGSIVDQGIPDTRDVIATLDAFDASDVVDAPIVDVANISEAGDAGPDVAPTDIPVIVDGGPGTGTLRVTGLFLSDATVSNAMNAGSFSTSYSLNINRGTTAVIDALVVINSSLGRLGVDARYDTGQLHRPSGATYAGYATLISTAETAVPDTGSVDIPITALRTDPGTSRPDFVRVRRVALNPIPGATTGSVIYMGVRNSVDIVVDGI